MRQLLHGIRDEGEHWPHFRLRAPEPMSDPQMRAVKAPGAAGPEIFGRVLACKRVEVANLWSVAAGDAYDMMFGKLKCLASALCDVDLLHLRSRRDVIAD